MEKLPRIPGYSILRKIDKGGSAIVYLAVDAQSKREVAIKVLMPSLLKDKQYFPRFLKEADIVARLNHTHIVDIHKVGQHGKYKYIVMEYLKESLKTRLNQRTVLPDKEALLIVAQVADALAHAHSKNIIHRDIKPANILFRDKHTAVVVDFGLARALDASRITITGMILGTMAYMSPEQWIGKDVDHLSDIYSLGVILYELLTGQLPYLADNTRAIFYRHLNSPIPRLPGNLNKYQPLIDGMMAKEKSNRIQGAREVIDLIEQLEPGMIRGKNNHQTPPKPNHKIDPGIHHNPGVKKPPVRHQPPVEVKRKKNRTYRTSLWLKRLQEKKLKAKEYIRRRRKLLRVLKIVLIAACILFLAMLILSISEIVKNTGNKAHTPGKSKGGHTAPSSRGLSLLGYSQDGIPILCDAEPEPPGNREKQVKYVPALAGSAYDLPGNRDKE